MNRNCTLGLSLNLFTAICMAGNERLQGPHQVAQKSSTTTLPFRLSELTVLPFTSFNTQAGDGLLMMVFFRFSITFFVIAASISFIYSAYGLPPAFSFSYNALCISLNCFSASPV